MKALAALSTALMILGCRSETPPEPTEPVEAPVEAPAEPAAPEPSATQPVPEVDRLSPPSKQLGVRRLLPTEKVILDGLRWLARHQNPDGSWGALALTSRCVGDDPCSDPALKATEHYDEGLTALALLCFLDAGFSPKLGGNLVDRAVDRHYRIEEIIQKGLEWLRARQQPDGSFTAHRAFMYNEALATMAMAKAYGITQDPYWKEPAQKAVDFLQKAQHPNPSGSGSWGWRYTSRAEIEARFRSQLFDSDTSVTAWCVMALESAQLSGLQVKQESMDGAMEFCKFVTANDGLVGYLDAKSAGATVTGPFSERFTYHPTVMSALGMCIRIFATHNADDPFYDLAAKRIIQDRPKVEEDGSSLDYYYWYYASLALNQIDGPDSPRKTGKYWLPWNKDMVDAVISLQDHTERACSNGGWMKSDRWGSYSGTGPLYNTAMNVRTLAVFFNGLSALPPKHPLLGTPAPEIVAIEGPGSRFVLSELRGKVVLIDFLSSGAAGFEMDVQARSSFARRMKDEGIAILTICLTDSAEDPFPPRETRAEWPWTCIRVRDANDPILQEYKVSKFPTTIVVDPAGYVRSAPAGWDDTVVLVNFLLETERRRQPK